mmetsp:Transcript_6219/g.13582  ORF Transcript_6219/g.13582 Transcript_6219/m.13582 type:complete len:262 (+) Transcript_6219:990-1775(+)
MHHHHGPHTGRARALHAPASAGRLAVRARGGCRHDVPGPRAEPDAPQHRRLRGHHRRGGHDPSGAAAWIAGPGDALVPQDHRCRHQGPGRPPQAAHHQHWRLPARYPGWNLRPLCPVQPAVPHAPQLGLHKELHLRCLAGRPVSADSADQPGGRHHADQQRARDGRDVEHAGGLVPPHAQPQPAVPRHHGRGRAAPLAAKHPAVAQPARLQPPVPHGPHAHQHPQPPHRAMPHTQFKGGHDRRGCGQDRAEDATPVQRVAR